MDAAHDGVQQRKQSDESNQHGDDIEFRLGELGKKRPDSERSFRLSHENTGGDVEGFRAAGAHHASHDPRGSPDDELHYAEVIEHRKKGGNKDDRGKYLESK